MAHAYVTVDDKNFDAEVLKSDTPVLVDFWAPWCGPCRAIAPHVEALAKEWTGKVKVAKVNVDEAQGVATRYGIRSIPTVLVFKNGEVKNQMVGVPPTNQKAKLQELVDKVA